MTTTTTPTSDLTGAALDWAVAHASGLTAPERITCPECHGNGEVTLFGYGTITEHARCPKCDGECTVLMPPGHPWWNSYSTSWEHAGPIIQREFIALMPVSDATWHATDPDGANAYGPTPLIAAMRCYVASKLGETVDVPEELAT